MSRVIVAVAPTRIDFAGGTLDIPPLYLFHQPALTINVAINLCATVTVQERTGRGVRLSARDQDTQAFWASSSEIEWRQNRFLELVSRHLRSFAPLSGVEVITDCQAPAGAGTGGSSALAVAATAALASLKKRRLAKPELIEYARAVETQTIRVPTGYQDYYAAAYGGASVLEFGLTGIVRRPVATGKFLEELEHHLLLVYTGKPRSLVPTTGSFSRDISAGIAKCSASSSGSNRMRSRCGRLFSLETSAASRRCSTRTGRSGGRCCRT